MFEEVNTNSIQIWKFGMYFLVVEYDVKPVLPPPFIFFEHVILFLRFAANKCAGMQHEIGKTRQKPFKVHVLARFRTG